MPCLAEVIGPACLSHRDNPEQEKGYIWSYPHPPGGYETTLGPEMKFYFSQITMSYSSP